MRSGKQIVRAQLRRLLNALTQEGAWVLENPKGVVWCEVPSTCKALGVDEALVADIEDPQGFYVFEAIDTGEEHTFMKWRVVLGMVLPRSRHPAAQRYCRWFIRAYLPALLTHGVYDPGTNHAVPVRHELCAVERREWVRDWLEALPSPARDRLIPYSAEEAADER
jgi:hypothetical protein